MKEIAILGPTASGKSALAVEIAEKIDAVILSLDSLSIYKGVNIVSAKPTIQERGGIRHFGIDVLHIDEYFSAATFFDLYKEAKAYAQSTGKHLLITGGTGFYLKALIEGLSARITPSLETMRRLEREMSDLKRAYAFITERDSVYASKIESRDRYRIQKWYEIYLESGMTATDYFQQHKKSPLIETIDIYAIDIDREILRERIARRTRQMIEMGLVEEIFLLERRYGRTPRPMGAIGIKETLEYLDGRFGLWELEERISIHTAQLAKRQRTFNASQFPAIIIENKEKLKNSILNKV
ncbi:MAG: tRNA (adenosine(37)-N6)-dimethylallyltransferase MiaA [Campylobacteraceae bacterium 4484_4]|nr:MAG: tRNA (adenosine(37)-N6)-dimethylallyltransferase MiaA [Campylobacteraceae bacterium 4484_4]